MQTFIMTGKYSSNALKNASATRTRKAEHLIGRYRGKVRAMYAVLGEHDLVVIVDLPGIEEAVKVSTGLMELTGISFNTIPAIPVSEFDKLIQER
jgi:uncharacterized protein with GYD domain